MAAQQSSQPVDVFSRWTTGNAVGNDGFDEAALLGGPYQFGKLVFGGFTADLDVQMDADRLGLVGFAGFGDAAPGKLGVDAQVVELDPETFGEGSDLGHEARDEPADEIGEGWRRGRIAAVEWPFVGCQFVAFRERFDDVDPGLVAHLAGCNAVAPDDHVKGIVL